MQNILSKNHAPFPSIAFTLSSNPSLRRTSATHDLSVYFRVAYLLTSTSKGSFLRFPKNDNQRCPLVIIQRRKNRLDAPKVSQCDIARAPYLFECACTAAWTQTTIREECPHENISLQRSEILRIIHKSE